MQNLNSTNIIMQKVLLELVKNLSVKERLVAVVLDHSLVTIKIEDFSGLDPAATPLCNECYTQLRLVQEKLTATPARGLEATYIASIEAMTDHEAEEVAFMLTGFARAVSELVGWFKKV